MRSVALRPTLVFVHLASANRLSSGFAIVGELIRLVLGPFVAAVAPGLLLRAATSTVVVCLAGFHLTLV